MRNHPRWSRIFAACAVLAVLVGVGSMFVIVVVGYVGIGHGSLFAYTSPYFVPHEIRWEPATEPWGERLPYALLPQLVWPFGALPRQSVSSWPLFVVIPLWMPAVGFAALAWFTRSRAKPPGCCGKCGYNLTGNVSGRCPECGLANPSATRDCTR